MNIVLFEDPFVERLFPITLTRPAYAITCGSLRLIDLAKCLSGEIGGSVRSYLTDFQRDYLEWAGEATPKSSQPTLWLNARLIPDATLLESLHQLQSSGDPCCVMNDGVVAAAITEANRPLTASDLPNAGLPTADIELPLINYPHDLVAAHLELTRDNLLHRIETGNYQEIADHVFAAPGTKLPENVVFETGCGPVVIEAEVRFGAFSVVQGPVYLGANVKVAPHALLKGPVSIGHTCKVGGEIGGTIMEPYSNKVHHGYLGTSWVGSWVNLGAGTSNSNLKNTYGTVRVEYEDGKQDTGMLFFGCVIGDFTKAAINTSIFTGKILGVCSNVYGTVTTNVPSFANFARSFGEVTRHPADVMKVTQQRVFNRRGIEQEPRHLQLLDAIHEIEAPKHKLANKPPSL